MSSSAGNGSGGRRPGRGGGRGRPRGGGGGNGTYRRGGGGAGRGRPNNNNYSQARGGNATTTDGNSEVTAASSDSIMMRDEDVLIAFMPYLRNDDNEARDIHEQYQNHQDQHIFLRAARDFLQRQSNGSNKAKSAAQPQSSTNSAWHKQTTEPTTAVSDSQSSFLSALVQTSSGAAGLSTPSAQRPASEAPVAVSTSNSSPIVPLPSILTSAAVRLTEQPQMQHASTALPDTSAIPPAALESPRRNLLVDDDDPVVSGPLLSHSSPTPIRPATLPIGSKSPSNAQLPFESSMAAPPTFPSNASMNGAGLPNITPKAMFPMSSTPPRPPGSAQSVISSTFGAAPSPSASLLFVLTRGQSSPGDVNANGSWLPTMTFDSSSHMPTTPSTPNAPSSSPGMTTMDHAYSSDGVVSNAVIVNNNNMITPNSSRLASTPATPLMNPSTPATTAAAPTTLVTPTTTTKRDFGPPKRMWMNFEDQPGRLLANDVPANLGQVLDLRPRQELTAKWMLPLSYLQQRSPINNPATLRDALFSLTVGLFRRGCTDNGQNASIISKQVLASLGESRNDYPYQVQGNVVVGTIPFYAPRTPGHVVFRLYWQDDPIHTLATGPTLNVRVTAEDLDPTLRFILSNLKGKKVNPTSLSSLHALALVMEQIHVPNHQTHHHHHHLSQQQQQQPFLESAGRALWGCICEARKVVDACALEHEKTNAKLAVLEQEVEALKEEITTTAKTQAESEDIAMAVAVAAVADDEDDMDPLDDLAAAIADDFLDAGEPNRLHPNNNQKNLLSNEDEDDPTASAAAKLREKTRTLLSGRASSERKWRDSQLAFSGILKAAVTNPSISLMLRRELIAKMRLEYELWCPLCEEFAIPASLANNASDQPNGSKVSAVSNDANESLTLWYRPLNDIPHSAVNGDHFRLCRLQRGTMQVELLGFDPNMLRLDDILFPKTPRRNSPSHQLADNSNHRTMDAAAVNVFNQLSAAMGQLYQEEYATADFVFQQREIIRSQTEKFVALCDLFPPGTKVAIFGSSANGFGSRQSDLDMCVQLPPGAQLVDNDDATGSLAMAKLAEILKEGGMQDVDTVRLTARIPIIRFNCPKPLRDGQVAECIECDLSMHNPLAVLNTSLLRTYAEINPVTRVLAAIIKRWAKARDINDPSRHTLSSYGYIIMLLHFLTYHQRTGNGLVAPVAGPQGKPLRQNRQATPLLPNLQWMDSTWPQSPPGTPYRELPSLPNNVRLPHPSEASASVNTYFYRPSDPSQLAELQRLFPGQDLSLAILLCSFFRYYAYEFDFKHHVISLHSTASRGLVEREAKAETDGWRNYSAALTIEDPFETFYDIAHVLRGGYYHRIRREFALAYTKIADAASGRVSTVVWHDKGDVRSMTGLDLINWICEPVAPALDSNDAERL